MGRFQGCIPPLRAAANAADPPWGPGSLRGPLFFDTALPLRDRYRYDASGLRYYVQRGTGEAEFVAREGEMGGAVVGRFGATWGALRVWNLLGPTGEVVGRIEPSGEPGGARRYYYKDALGSVRAVVDAAGQVVESRDYSPWGLEMEGRVYVSGSKAEEGFTGHELDDETGLLYAGARYLDPAIGRWMSTDPMAHKYPGWSPYNYAANNPLIVIDPDGMDWYCTTNDDGNCTSYQWDGDLTAENASERLGAGQKYINFGTVYTADNGLTVLLGEGGGWGYLESASYVYARSRVDSDFAIGVMASGSVPLELGLAAMRGHIHGGQAAFLQNSAVMAGHGLSVAAALTGVGAGALGVRMMLTSGGRSLTISAVRIGIAEAAATRFALTSSASFLAGGDYENATIAAVGGIVGQTATLGRAAFATRGLVSTAGRTGGTLFRYANTGRFAANSVYGVRYGAYTLGAFGVGYVSAQAAGNVIDY